MHSLVEMLINKTYRLLLITGHWLISASFYPITKLYVSKSKFLGGFYSLSGSESLSTAGKESKKMEEHLAWSSPAPKWKKKKGITHTAKFCKITFTEWTGLHQRRSYSLVRFHKLMELYRPKMWSKAIQFSEIFSPGTEKGFIFNLRSCHELAYRSS